MEQDETKQNQGTMPEGGAEGNNAGADVPASVPENAVDNGADDNTDTPNASDILNTSDTAAPSDSNSDDAAAGPAPESETTTDSGGDAGDDDFEPLTDTYEELRHTQDSAELSAAAREPLPPRSEQAAFSRATALLEAVAGNQNTPLEDRIFLASTMPFPNILVKLSEDENDDVREAVAANADDKNWLVGRLTKDRSGKVREAALRNPQTSWKMRLEGAQNPETSADTLDFLAKLGVETEPKAPTILAAMVRRAAALNPNCAQATLQRLAQDESTDVSHAAQGRLG